VYFTGALCQFYITFLERYQAVRYATLAFVQAIICRIEYIG
jgi:hypothetical protein